MSLARPNVAAAPSALLFEKSGSADPGRRRQPATKEAGPCLTA
jgi:hypothetical protein